MLASAIARSADSVLDSGQPSRLIGQRYGGGDALLALRLSLLCFRVALFLCLFAASLFLFVIWCLDRGILLLAVNEQIGRFRAR